MLHGDGGEFVKLSLDPLVEIMGVARHVHVGADGLCTSIRWYSVWL
jgi:hypothetical protein